MSVVSNKQFADRRPGFMDILNWAFVPDSGVVQCKDGSLLAGWFYNGPDLSSSLDDSMNWLSDRANEALIRLGGGWTMWVDACRLQAPTYFDPSHSSFPDPISSLVEEERRQHFNGIGRLYETEKAVMLQYTPPHKVRGKLVNLVYDGEDLGGDKSEAAAILRAFDAALADFEDSLSGVMQLRRMGDTCTVDAFGASHVQSELVNYLNYCVTGRESTLNLPPGNFYLDFILGGAAFAPGDEPMVGDRYVSVVAIMGCPAESFPGILSVLDILPVPYRFSQRFIFMDQPEAEKSMKNFEAKWNQRIVGWIAKVFRAENPRVNDDAVEMTQQAKQALARSSSGLEYTGYYTPVIVIYSDSPSDAREQARLIEREIRNLGFNTRTETINATEAFIGSLPGHSVQNVRRPPLHTQNLSHFLPLTGVYRGRPTNPCPYYPPNSPALLQAVTTGSAPFYLNLHHGDVGHALYFGPIGAGKSTLLATTMIQGLRYPGMRIWTFDKGMSLFAATKACGGNHYEIGGDDRTLAFCPLSVLDTDADVAWAEEWIATCFELQFNEAPLPSQRDQIHQAIMRMRAPGVSRSLTHFAHEVQDQRVREAMQHYTLAGPVGHMLDAESDSLQDGRLITFEIEELMAMGDKQFVPIILYLFRRFEKSLRGQPSLLLLDEGWVMFTRQTTQEKIREYLKVLRKLNCAVVLATQSLSDAMRSGLLDVITESCPTKVFLANDAAGNEGTENYPGPAAYYRGFGLNDAQIEIIRSAVPKRHYYVTSPAGNGLIDLQLGPIALSFVGAGSKDDIAAVRHLVEKDGRDWPCRWLEQRGVSYT